MNVGMRLMLDIADDASLIAAIAGGNAEMGERLIARARHLGVDPLQLVRSETQLSEDEVYARAAHCCGLAFSSVIPELAQSQTAPAHLGALSNLRSLRMTLFDREVLFIAPDFAHLRALGRHAETHPEMRGRTCIVPPSILRSTLQARFAEQLLDHSRQRLAQIWPFASAHLDLTIGLRLGFVTGFVLVLTAAVLAPFHAQFLLVPLMLALLFFPSWFRFAAIIDEPDAHDDLVTPLAEDSVLPVYSVLVPLRDEAHMVGQLAGALRALDYPAEKLDIKFVVETDSPETIAAVQRELWDGRFEQVIVPHAAPHTKPKALNFALPLVRGTHVVVYDAEDVPASDQLRKAATLFIREPEVACIQAELVAENAGENALTALFAAEYGGLFGIMLPALAHWGFPMPLGGTSNHFRVEVLRALGGWDAFNVTEDADIGVRLARWRAKTRTMRSQTLEEAPVSLRAWMRQRTRWMKGWMQTFLVHNRRPGQLLDDIGPKNFLAFQVYIGGIILTPPLHTLFMLAVAARFVIPGEHPQLSDPLVFLQYFILATGYLSAVALSINGMMRLGHSRLLKYQLLLPIYWALMGIASFRAAYELVFRPYFWAKTSHGKSRWTRSVAAQLDRRQNPAQTQIDPNENELPGGRVSKGARP